MTVWFTSDLYLGNSSVAGARGFRTAGGEPDVGAHNAAVLDGWRGTVQPGDQVWVLGNPAVTDSPAQFRYMLDVLSWLPGEKHLIAGCHDPVHPGNPDSHTWFREYMKTFASVQAFAAQKVLVPLPGGPGETGVVLDVMLSHFPYRGAGDADAGPGDRFAQYRLPDTGNCLIHGHTCSNEKRLGPRGINVGVGSRGLRPVPLTAVEALISESAKDCRPDRAAGEEGAGPEEEGGTPDGATPRYLRMIHREDGITVVRKATGDANRRLDIIRRRTRSALKRMEYPSELAVKSDLWMIQVRLEKALEEVGKLLEDTGWD